MKGRIFGALFIAVTLIALCGIAVAIYYAVGSGDGGSSSSVYCAPPEKDDYRQMYPDEKRAKFRTPVMTVHPGKHNEVLFSNVGRPMGDVAVHMVRAHVRNAHTDTIVKNTQVYNHHLFVADYHPDDPRSFRILAALGAEAMRFDRPLQKPFVFISEGDKSWAFSAHLVNQWGMASLASMDVYVEYEIFYREIDDMNRFRPFGVSFDIYGQGISAPSPSSPEEEAEEGNEPQDFIDESREKRALDAAESAEAVADDRENPFLDSGSFNVIYSKSSYHDDDVGEVGVDVPGNGAEGSLFEIESVFQWTDEDTILVWAAGHLHIGALDLDVSVVETNEMVFSSRALYDDSGFIEDITHQELLFELKRGMMLRLTARYDNAVDYGNVMALALFTTTDNIANIQEYNAALERLGM